MFIASENCKVIRKQLTLRQVQYVEDDSRKQQGRHSFSLYQDDQGLVPFHLCLKPSAGILLPVKIKLLQNIIFFT